MSYLSKISQNKVIRADLSGTFLLVVIVGGVLCYQLPLIVPIDPVDGSVWCVIHEVSRSFS